MLFMDCFFQMKMQLSICKHQGQEARWDRDLEENQVTFHRKRFLKVYRFTG